jgi:leader peptidase (prepilin peptidase)/N-methyltransferase
MIPYPLDWLLIVLLGLSAGSFLNVVIARLPDGRSLMRPASACPRCRAAIAWRDNIPLLSYALLGGRCRRCAAPISWQYPAVEAATAGLWALAYARWGPGVDLAAGWLFLGAMVAITAIDLDRQIIPDALTLPGIGVGVVASLLSPRVSWLDSLIGIALGGGIFVAIILASRGGMGGGDMKLGAMLGAFLGWKLALVALLIAVLAGGGVAIVLLALGRKGRKEAVPFGPFLALGGTVALFGGEAILRWYLGRFIR